MSSCPQPLAIALWTAFKELLPVRTDTHPIQCHNPRVSDEIIFYALLKCLTLGPPYVAAAAPGYSERTIRRRRDEWISLGLFELLHQLVVDAYADVAGLDLDVVVVNGCHNPAPGGGKRCR